MRQLSPEVLPSESSVGLRITTMELHVGWHLGTIAFLAVGVELLRTPRTRSQRGGAWATGPPQTSLTSPVAARS
jgi:hypothetical protein